MSTDRFPNTSDLKRFVSEFQNAKRSHNAQRKRLCRVPIFKQLSLSGEQQGILDLSYQRCSLFFGGIRLEISFW